MDASFPNRVIHASADGLGKQAGAVVAPMLPSIVCAPGLDMVRTMLSAQDGSLISARSMASVLRQWQLALELPSLDSVVITSIRRVQQLLHLRRHTISTAEVQALPPAERQDSMAPVPYQTWHTYITHRSRCTHVPHIFPWLHMPAVWLHIIQSASRAPHRYVRGQRCEGCCRCTRANGQPARPKVKRRCEYS